MNPLDIEKFFEETNSRSGFSEKERFFFFRKDGHVLFSSSKKHFITSLAALSTGAWQAAFSLIQSIEDSDDEKNFRFSFDTSSEGILILPLRLNSEVYYGALIYEDQINPGFLKNKFKNLVDKLEYYLIESGSNEPQLGNQFLFKDITDAEIDNLFSFAGE